MKKKIFIQTNDKQYLGALIAKYAIERFFDIGEKVPVEIMNTDEIEPFVSMRNKKYKMETAAGMVERTYTNEDLQSFTFSRFLPPELMNYEGRALVIDPDVFALVDPREILNIDLNGNALAAVRRKGGQYKSSVMVLDCAKLEHWKVEDLFDQIINHGVDSRDWITLRREKSILSLDPGWNSHDTIDHNTKMLHCTRKKTQPWKTGLPIDFMVVKPMQRIFGIIPREWVKKLQGQYHVPTHYVEHPEKVVEAFFFTLAQAALDNGDFDVMRVQKEIDEDNIRPDFFEMLWLYSGLKSLRR